jgi:hypothetical protein
MLIYYEKTMAQIDMDRTNSNNKIIIHARLYIVEGGSWHSSKQKIKQQWER